MWCLVILYREVGGSFFGWVIIGFLDVLERVLVAVIFFALGFLYLVLLFFLGYGRRFYIVFLVFRLGLKV